MSVGDEVTYIYEPLFGVTFNGIRIENLEDMEIVRKYLNDLFQCEISYNKRPLLHKNLESCKISNAQCNNQAHRGGLECACLFCIEINYKWLE